MQDPGTGTDSEADCPLQKAPVPAWGLPAERSEQAEPVSEAAGAMQVQEAWQARGAPAAPQAGPGELAKPPPPESVGRQVAVPE